MKRFFYITIIIIATLIILMKSCMTMRTSDDRAIKAFDKAGVPVSFGTQAINGRHLHYAKTGSDTLPTIIFVHGSPGSWYDYKKYLMDSTLLQHYRLISIDRPGFGESDYGQPLTLQPQADMIGQLLKQVKNGKPLYLVGHSYGGPLVSLLAVDYPQYINGVVILAGALDAALEGEGRWRKVMDAALIRCLVPTPMRTSNEELMHLKPDLVTLEPQLPLIKADIWVMQGRKDMLVDPGNAEFIQQHFTGARSMHLIYFPKENHFIPWTRFEEIRDLLMGLPNPQIP